MKGELVVGDDCGQLGTRRAEHATLPRTNSTSVVRKIRTTLCCLPIHQSTYKSSTYEGMVHDKPFKFIWFLLDGLQRSISFEITSAWFEYCLNGPIGNRCQS